MSFSHSVMELGHHDCASGSAERYKPARVRLIAHSETLPQEGSSILLTV